jgi:hypothetical protein
MRRTRLKAAIHPWIDPLLSLPDEWRARRTLDQLPDGEYRAGVDVPYYAQFASPERIGDYIHHGYDGTQDPRWQTFGADNPADYAFWAPRVCALACLKMAIEAFYPQTQPSLWQLVQEGLAAKGYTVRDELGRWIDEGWTYHAQVYLANRYRLQAVGRSYISPLTVCWYIREGWLVSASVTPELGERQPTGQQYGGHLVLVYGFGWKKGCPTHYYLHNPSGRFPELQAHTRVPATRFAASFAHRLIALRPGGPF